MSTQPTGTLVPPPPPYVGREYNRDHDGTFLKTWNVLMLAEELPEGKIIGKQWLGTKVIVYRDKNGDPVVQSAYCPHVGADLSIGDLVDGEVRCAYHHWRFATDGRCTYIPTEDHIPRVARIYRYPAAEKWGMIFAFNGEEPLFDLPEFPNMTEDEVVYKPYHRGYRQGDGWIGASNTVDFLHLRTVHGVADPNPTKVEFTDYTLTVRQEAPTRIADTILYGGSFLALHIQMADGVEQLFMAGGSQVAPGWSDSYFVVAMRKEKAEALGPEGTEAEFNRRIAYIEKLYAEDGPILQTIRFRGYGKSMLIKADKHMGAFLRWMETYPRAAPFDV